MVLARTVSPLVNHKVGPRFRLAPRRGYVKLRQGAVYVTSCRSVRRYIKEGVMQSVLTDQPAGEPVATLLLAHGADVNDSYAEREGDAQRL